MGVKRAAPGSADRRWAAVVAALADDPQVPQVRKPAAKRRGFGSQSLCVGDKIFAMLVDGQLVVKLAASRAEELIAAGEGEAFVVGRRRMKQWVVLGDEGSAWLGRAREALEFVAGSRKTPRRRGASRNQR